MGTHRARRQDDPDDPALRMREPVSMDYFAPEWERVDALLGALDVDYLQEVEFIGARLYTGPLYIKYNACLRGMGVAAMEKRWNEICLGNRYTTTLHVINSAVVKLGKLQVAEKVYRGVTGEPRVATAAPPTAYWRGDRRGEAVRGLG